jgi:hypothetical protein
MTIKNGRTTPVNERRKPTKIKPSGDIRSVIDITSMLQNGRVQVQSLVEI